MPLEFTKEDCLVPVLLGQDIQKQQPPCYAITNQDNYINLYILLDSILKTDQEFPAGLLTLIFGQFSTEFSMKIEKKIGPCGASNQMYHFWIKLLTYWNGRHFTRPKSEFYLTLGEGFVVLAANTRTVMLVLRNLSSGSLFCDRLVSLEWANALFT